LVFIGDNEPAREQAASNFLKSFISQHSSTAVDKFAANETELFKLLDAVSTTPFLSDRRLVIVRDLGIEKTLADQIEKICQSVADTTDLMIIENHIDSRSRYLNFLKKTAEVREFLHLEGEALTNWVIEHSADLGGKISFNDAQALIDRVGTNHQLLESEIKKLLIFDKNISLKNIELLTVYNPQSSVFAMLDAAFTGNITKALGLYEEQRTQGMEPQAILGMIVWQLNVLAIIKSAGQMPVQEIVAQAKLSPFVIRKNRANTKRISNQKLAHLLKKAIHTDMMIKTTNVKADNALQSLIMAFA
jgi:DNA polymerase-3 subunit delta